MPFKTRDVVILTVLGAVFVGGASAFLLNTDDADRSGIRGQVGAGCLGEGCHQTPTIGLQEVRRATEGVKAGHKFPLVTKFWSRKDGTFEVSLPPGYYIIDEDPRSPPEGVMHPLGVTVREGEFTEVELFYEDPRNWVAGSRKLTMACDRGVRAPVSDSAGRMACAPDSESVAPRSATAARRVPTARRLRPTAQPRFGGHLPALGSVIETVVPRPGAVSSETLPALRSASAWTIARPRPLPPVRRDRLALPR